MTRRPAKTAAIAHWVPCPSCLLSVSAVLAITACAPRWSAFGILARSSASSCMPLTVSVVEDVVDQLEEPSHVQRLGQELPRASGAQPLDLAGSGIGADHDHGNLAGSRVTPEPLQYLGPRDVG